MRSLGRKESWLLFLGFWSIASLPLFICGFPWNTHDGWIQHIWQECFTQQFWDGELYPRWLPEPNQGFGGATYFFYPPLPFWVGAFVEKIAQLVGVPPSIALGWSAALGLLFSGLAMRYCLRTFVQDQWILTAGALLYMLAPYHWIIDLLDRGAYTEFWSFVWLPLIVGATRRLRVSRMAMVLLALSWAGLLLTHLPMSVTFFPTFLLIALLEIGSNGRKLCCAGALSLGLSASYWLPAFCYRTYTKGASDPWFSGEGIASTFFFPSMDWQLPLFTNDVFNRRLLVLFLGMVLILILVQGIMFFMKPRDKKNLVCWVGSLTFCILMMTPCMNWLYVSLPFLRSIQFSWRFLGCATLASVFISILVVDAFWNRRSNILFTRAPLWIGRTGGIGMWLLLLGTSCCLGWVKYQDAFWNKEMGTWHRAAITDLYERNAAGEHDPIGANLQEALRLFPGDVRKSPEERVPIFKKTSERVEVLKRAPRQWVIKSRTSSSQTLLIPQYWFAGWETVVDKEGTKEIVPTEADPLSGLIQVQVPSGDTTLRLSLEALWPERAGEWISFLSLIVTGWLAFLQPLLKTRSSNPTVKE